MRDCAMSALIGRLILNYMAYFNNERLQIELTDEEEELFKECSRFVNQPSDKREYSQMAKKFMGFGYNKNNPLTF